MESESFVYLLICSDNSTYVGATKNLDRRLRQHNGEIKGGATITTSKIKSGNNWSRVCYVSGFPDWRSALQFEWRWKQISRKLNIRNAPVERRLEALNKLLLLNQATSKSLPYELWETSPNVVFEDEKYEMMYKFYESV